MLRSSVPEFRCINHTNRGVDLNYTQPARNHKSRLLVVEMVPAVRADPSTRNATSVWLGQIPRQSKNRLTTDRV